MALILREKERKERLGNFLWDRTKIAKECECGDLEREGWVFASTLGSRKAK
jgi:hypothetical protein